ncbi:MAG: metallophosphoesterase family protein [Terracidiphilus sp.]
MKTIQGRFREAVFFGAAVSVLTFTAGANAQNQNSNNNQWPYGNPTPDNTWPYATLGRSPVLAVVGDVSCEPGETEPGGEKAGESCASTKAPYTSTPGILWQSQEATANQIEAMKPDLVAILGDLQYQVGQYSDFEGSYDLTYGAFKMITRPAPGNHEFYDEHSATGVAGYGYFSYFNGFQIDATGAPVTATITDPCPSGLVWNDPNTPNPASAPASPCGYPGATEANPQPVPRADGQAGHFEEPPDGVGVGVGDGWYSYNLGSWHLISLNIECSTQPGGCSNTGAWFAAELEWLKKDLEANHSACTLAYWHQPTFSATNGISQEGVTAQAFWQLLYQYHADLVLNGHDHLYARYRPLNPSGNYDPVRGIRQFTVGSGGETLDPIVLTPVTSAQATSTGSTETNQEDPSGNVSFNAQNLQAYTGDFWGVMGLTLNQNGYAWDFESALAGPTGLSNGPTLPAPNANGGYSDKGFGACHGSANRW